MDDEELMIGRGGSRRTRPWPHRIETIGLAAAAAVLALASFGAGSSVVDGHGSRTTPSPGHHLHVHNSLRGHYLI